MKIPSIHYRQLPRDNNYEAKKGAQLRRLHGLTVMKGLQKQKHLITIISFLLLATSTMLVLLLKWQPPLKRLP